jgi:hypothetical protein
MGPPKKKPATMAPTVYAVLPAPRRLGFYHTGSAQWVQADGHNHYLNYAIEPFIKVL